MRGATLRFEFRAVGPPLQGESSRIDSGRAGRLDDSEYRVGRLWTHCSHGSQYTSTSRTSTKPIASDGVRCMQVAASQCQANAKSGASCAVLDFAHGSPHYL